MQIITMYQSFYVSGKMKDVCRYLQELKKSYSTVKEFLEHKLH
jgi:hypothetical protein